MTQKNVMPVTIWKSKTKKGVIIYHHTIGYSEKNRPDVPERYSKNRSKVWEKTNWIQFNGFLNKGNFQISDNDYNDKTIDKRYSFDKEILKRMGSG